MKLAIVTVSTPEISDLIRVTSKYMEIYCKKVGADFIHLTPENTDFTKYKHPKYYVMAITEVTGYDRVLWVDADIFIKPTSPNIFEMFKDNSVVYAYDEMELRNSAWKSRYDRIISEHTAKNSLPKARFGREHWNGGVLLFPGSETKKLFSMPPWDICSQEYSYTPYNSVKQQPWRNYLIARSGLKTMNLGRRWNHLPSARSKISARNSYFLHLTGFPGWRGGQYEKLNYLRKASKDCDLLPEDSELMNRIMKRKKVGNWRFTSVKKRKVR